MRPPFRYGSSALLVLFLPAYAAGDVRLSVPEVAVSSGSTTAEFAVVLGSSEESVAGTQNDITVTPPLSFATRANGRPDCTANPAINKNGTSFAFLDTPCGEGVCYTIRTLVLALDNVDAIAVPAELYRCRLLLDEGASGAYSVHLSNAGASDPAGNLLAVETIDGSVFVGGGTTEAAQFAVGDGSLCGPAPGMFEVTYTYGPSLSGASHVVRFDAAAPIASDDAGRPRCAAVAPLDADDATFTFVPDGCVPGGECEGVQVFLRGHIGNPAIESVPLYRCEVDPPPLAAAGTYALHCTDARASSSGIPSLVAVCRSGTFTTGACAPWTPTRTPEETVTPTVPAPPPSPSATATVRTAAGNGDEGGCAIARPGRGRAWPLLIGLGMLGAAIWRRRRSPEA